MKGTSITTNHLVVDDEGLTSLLRARDDLIEEELVSEPGTLPACFHVADGPFDVYERRIDAEAADDGTHRVHEQVTWSAAIPIWGPLFRPLLRRQFQRTDAPRSSGSDDPGPRAPWWAPPDRLNARAAAVLSRLCGLSMLAGYLGTTITQTLTFAADEFGASKQAQGATLSAVRIGILLSLLLMAAADRKGRKRLLTICAVGGAVSSAAGALAPNLVALGVTQTFARAFATALALLIGVVAAEEMPAGGRAYAASVLAMTAALGAGLAVALLPLAGLATPAWRIIYLVPILGLVFFVRVADLLPESRRFLRPHGRATMAGHRGRLVLLAVSGFFALIFLAPASQFQNDFLRDEHGFAAWQLTLFTFLTNTPAGIGIIVGGRLADQRGRKLVGAVGLLSGTALLAIGYQSSGVSLWIFWLLGAVMAAATVPALGVYGPELFPTALRAKANGLITLGSVLGSGVGLGIAGRLADRYGTMGPGIALLGIGPVIVAIMVIAFYPETAHLELEEINPEDAPSALGIAPPGL